MSTALALLTPSYRQFYSLSLSFTTHTPASTQNTPSPGLHNPSLPRSPLSPSHTHAVLIRPLSFLSSIPTPLQPVPARPLLTESALGHRVRDLELLDFGTIRGIFPFFSCFSPLPPVDLWVFCFSLRSHPHSCLLLYLHIMILLPRLPSFFFTTITISSSNNSSYSISSSYISSSVLSLILLFI